MLTRPDSIAWIAGIFLLAIVTVGFGVSSFMEQGADGGTQSAFFTEADERVTSTNSVFGTGVNSATALSSEEGQSEEPTEDRLITQGFNSFLSLGKVYNEVKITANQGTQYLGIPPSFWLIITALIITSLTVVIYTWVRAR